MKNIKKGDTVGIIALAGAVDKIKIQNAKKYFENLGFNVVLSKNIYDQNSYLAGCDEDKISELHSFFQNPDIKLIINARGGYGSIRLINKIDYNILRKNPKPFCGYSDITALLLMIYKKCGFATYHSPMASGDFGEEIINEHTAENFWQVINGNKLKYCGNKTYKSGSAEGILWGGNLSTVVSLCGQDFIPNQDFIFFTEDLNEPVYKIDKMFQQLINISDFTNYCKAIVLGDFLDNGNQESLEKYFYELAERMNIPIIDGFKITHLKEKITVPIGKRATLSDTELSFV